jgi:L-glyceraldehyde 3-phosphate reductase
VAEITRRTPPGARPVQRDRLSWLKFSAEPTRYDRMEFRRCGNSGLKLSAISLGAWETYGGYRGAEAARECIFGAFNLGITHFDLADNYGTPPGRAETFVGRVLREMPREEVIISTKAGAAMWPGPMGQGSSRKHLLASIDQSLLRMGLDHVDIFYSHRPDPDTPLEETLSALEQIVRQGKALYVGLSHYSRGTVEEASESMRHSNLARINVFQTSYNLLHREFEQDLKETERTAGIGIVACSPLSQGLLSKKYLDGFPEESRGAKVWSEQQRAAVTTALKERIRKLNEIARARGQTLPQMAIAWVLRRPEITSVLIGASVLEQIEENVKTLDNSKFSEEELRRIDEISAQ